jgi:ribonuclease HI
MSERTDGPVAYTDGGCLGNPGPGGWGVHVEYPDGRVIDLGGSDLHTTNNRMELRAAIEAARAVSGWPSATVIADSQYVLKGITSWIAGWKRKGWKTSTGQAVVNQDLWEELDAVSTDKLTWEWTRGHSGDPGNERCDEIAGWFSSSVAPLKGGRRPTPARAPAQAAAASGSRANAASGAAAASRPAAASRSMSGRPASGGQQYLSFVDGILARHATWGECERRVRGVRSARYKKVRNASEEQETLAKWGVTEADLFGVPSADLGV